MTTEYEERDARAKKDREFFHALVAEVTSLLGGRLEPAESATYLKIHLEAGMVIYAHIAWNAKGRIEFSGCYPTGLHDRRYYGSDFVNYKEVPKDKITCSMRRSAKDIVQDINSRLLPEYKILLDKCKKRIAQDRTHDLLQNQAMLAVAQVLGVESDATKGYGSASREQTIYFRAKEGSWANFMTRCHGSDVEIKLLVPTRTALRIAQIVRELSV